MKLPPPRDIVTQTLPLHIGVKESVQFAGEEHVVTTAVVAAIVFPVKGIVDDIARGLSPQHQRERAPCVCSVRHEAAFSLLPEFFQRETLTSTSSAQDQNDHRGTSNAI